MNDLISRSDFKKMLVKQFAGSGTHEDDTKEMDGWNCCLARIIDILDRQPTLEIVRCKDCKFKKLKESMSIEQKENNV